METTTPYFHVLSVNQKYFQSDYKMLHMALNQTGQDKPSVNYISVEDVCHDLQPRIG